METEENKMNIWMAVAILSLVALMLALVYIGTLQTNLSQARFDAGVTGKQLALCRISLHEAEANAMSWYQGAMDCAKARDELNAQLQDLNTDYQLLRKFFILYDQTVYYIYWYNDVNTCSDFIQNYYTAMDWAHKYRDFLIKYGDRIDRILDDQLAQSMGLSQGLRSYQQLHYVNEFIKNMQDDYDYCTSGD